MTSLTGVSSANENTVPTAMEGSMHKLCLGKITLPGSNFSHRNICCSDFY